MYKIYVALPVNRIEPGRLYLVDGAGRFLFEAACRGKADGARASSEGNPNRYTVYPYGDFPSGTYYPTNVVTLDPPHSRIGNAWIPLNGYDGDARDAASNGRTGLGIHATPDDDGDRGEQTLIATYGCLRVLDEEFAELCNILGDNKVLISVIDIPPLDD